MLSNIRAKFVRQINRLRQSTIDLSIDLFYIVLRQLPLLQCQGIFLGLILLIDIRVAISVNLAISVNFAISFRFATNIRFIIGIRLAICIRLPYNNLILYIYIYCRQLVIQSSRCILIQSGLSALGYAPNKDIDSSDQRSI